MLLLLVAGAASGCLETRLKFVSEFGTTGAGPNELKNPTDLCCDSKGNVYVCDTGNGRILKFDENGDAPHVFASGLKTPRGICADKSDQIYVAETGANRVLKFPPTGGKPRMSIIGTMRLGQALDKDNSLVAPHDVAVDEGGNIYILDYLHRLLVYDMGGAFLREFRNEGSGPSQFKFPTSIDVTQYTNENKAFLMYIADSHNTRIQKFDQEMKLIYMLKEKGLLDHIRDPRGIAVLPNGDFFVADCGATPIVGYASSGTLKWSGSSFGKGAGKILRSGGVAYYKYNSRLYVTDMLQDKVLVFSTK